MQWIEELESEPMDFLVRRLEGHLEEVRDRLGRLIGTRSDDLLLVDNATFAMNIVANSFALGSGDEVLATNHEYGAVVRIWRKRTSQVGARLVVQKLPEEFVEPEEIAETFLAGVTERTKLIVVSHITSPTALLLPVEEICRRAKVRGIPVCIDGPHALAAVPLDLDRLGCDFYCASGHKWLSAPFGSGFLYVNPRWKKILRPLVVSWGQSLGGRPLSWQDEFVWSGTRDPSSNLAIPAAIDFFEREAGGFDAFRTASRSLVDYTRRKIAAITGLEPIARDIVKWCPTMLSLPLPESVGEAPAPNQIHPLQAALWERHRIEVLVTNWSGRRYLRVSCHLYNDAGDIDRLAGALRDLLPS
jgi:isopenicillin-N epimerase